MADIISVQYSSDLAGHTQRTWVDGIHGDLPEIPRRRKDGASVLPLSAWNSSAVLPRVGRFYPPEVICSEAPRGHHAFRVNHVSRHEVEVDFNHPLAGKEVSIQRALSRDPAAALEVPACVEWAGMEMPLAGKETDFGDPDGFKRDDSRDDREFYETPRKVLHADRVCLSRIMCFYRSVIPPGARVLDLMSSWRSHLPDYIENASGLGMNKEEMDDNPQLSSLTVHDLNRRPVLPLEGETYDVVVNSLSFEYLTHPHEILREVRRILRPDGMLAITFSNRYFPPKAIRLWKRLHPAERTGWVLQCMRKAGFTELKTLVERGLQRGPDDRYSGKVREMDPLFALWGKRG